jgi:uncharacterized protein (DUF2345 family)
VDYTHGGLRAWYLNGPLGLEQGFTLKARPCAPGAGGVVIELGRGGDLRAEVSAQGDAATLRDARGNEVLRYSDLYVADATGRQLGARIEGSPGGLSIRVDDAGAVYPIEVDPLLWTQQQELVASDGASGERFGFSVSISGDTAVVGGVAGKVYVFVRSDTRWTLQQEIFAPSDAANLAFGQAVAVAGDTLVVGAPNSFPFTGVAFVYVRAGGTWTEQQELVASETTAGDFFGNSVAIDADTVVIGAPDALSFDGAAYVFVRSAGVWTEQQQLTANDSTGNDELGWSVAVNQDTAVVGAPFRGNNLGAAYVFVRSAGVWTEQQELSSGSGFEQVGFSVAVDGDTLVAGAPGIAVSTGAAFVFVRAAGVWTEQQELRVSDGGRFDDFGWSVALEGNTTVIGAIGHASGTGAAYVFARVGTTWTLQQELSASDAALGDNFGNSVAISDDTMIVGAPGKNDLQGAAYVFVRPPCPQAAVVGSTNLSPPFAFDGDCATDESVRELQYTVDRQPADLGTQCQQYCLQGGSACGTGWSLTAIGEDQFQGFGFTFLPTAVVGANLFGDQLASGQSASCYDRAPGFHRWLANCICP